MDPPTSENVTPRDPVNEMPPSLLAAYFLRRIQPKLSELEDFKEVEESKDLKVCFDKCGKLNVNKQSSNCPMKRKRRPLSKFSNGEMMIQ